MSKQPIYLFIGCDAHTNEPFNGGDERPLSLPLGSCLAGGGSGGAEGAVLGTFLIGCLEVLIGYL